jgi:hypothetical protein
MEHVLQSKERKAMYLIYKCRSPCRSTPTKVGYIIVKDGGLAADT